MDDELKPSPEAVLVDAIISAYHTTRLRNSLVFEHILSKQPVKDALAALATTQPAIQAATGPWIKVGTFEPDPEQLYIVQGSCFTSIKRGSDIDSDNLFAALVLNDPRTKQTWQFS